MTSRSNEIVIPSSREEGEPVVTSEVSLELDRAKAKIAQHTKSTTVGIHPTMLASTTPLTIVEEEGGRKRIQFNLLSCNHNIPNSSK